MSPAHVLEPTFRRLKLMLMDGLWLPGEKLEALQLAEEFGVSMTPVRDCLNRLVGEQLVDMKPGEGYRVTRITQKMLCDLFDLNVLLLEFAYNGGVGCDNEPIIGVSKLSYADRVSTLFQSTASQSGNIVLTGIVRSISERIHAIRQADLEFFPDAIKEIEAMESLAAASSPSLKPKLQQYHDRRRSNNAYLMFAAK